MGISNSAITVIQRPLDKERIKTRPGRGRQTFSFISADYVISLLNEAFAYKWDTKIVSHSEIDGNIVVALELRVWDEQGVPITKQQFGSCEIKGVGPGDAFKGAASDALKKCATLVGIGLELYYDETSSVGSFTPPVPSTSQTPQTRQAPPGPPKPPAAPRMPESFQGSPSPSTAAVPRPAAPRPDIPKTVPNIKTAEVAAPRTNPFLKEKEGQGPNPTQLNALNNLAEKKGLGQAEMIALATVVDDEGNPVQLFEDLTHAQAIQVIKAAQL